MSEFSELGSALSGLGSSLTNVKKMKQMAKFNAGLAEEAAQKAYGRQVDFWNMQNAYNDPAAARQRMENAGINPTTEMGSGVNAAGGLSTVAASTPTGVDPAGAASYNDPLLLAQRVAAIDKMSSESDLLGGQLGLTLAEKELKQALKDGTLSKTEYQNMLNDLYRIYGRRQSDADVRSAEAGARSAEAQAEVDENTVGSRIASADLEPTLKSTQIDLNNALKSLTDAQTQTEKERAANVVADTALKRAQTLLTSYEAVLADMEVEWSKSGEREFTVFGHTFKIGRNNYTKLRDAALATGRYNASQAGIIASTLEDTIELQQNESRMRAYASEMSGAYTERENSWWNRTLSQIHETARDIASFIPFTHPAPTRVRGYAGYY